MQKGIAICLSLPHLACAGSVAALRQITNIHTPQTQLEVSGSGPVPVCATPVWMPVAAIEALAAQGMVGTAVQLFFES